jgi:hypothetical protein
VAIVARGAVVTLDGREVPVRRGVARAKAVRAGVDHVLRVTAPGFKDHEAVVQVGSSQSVWVEPTLERRALVRGGRSGSRSDPDGIVVPWE